MLKQRKNNDQTCKECVSYIVLNCERTRDNEIDTSPPEYANFVVIVDTEEVHGHEENGNQHGNQ